MNTTREHKRTNILVTSFFTVSTMKRKTPTSPLPTPPLSEELSRAIGIIEFYEEVLEEQSARIEALAKENERLRELMKDNKPPRGAWIH